jgi:SAM-dependent methyltransferase
LTDEHLERVPDGVRQGVPSVLYDEDYFLGACEGYEEFASSEGEYLSRRLAEALSVAGIASGMRVLDVGCGRGEVLRHVSRLQAHPFGIDYAAVAVHFSREVADREPGPSIGVYRANARYLPFVGGSFDRILMLDIVEHLYPHELLQAMTEAYRVLRPGGRVVIHTAPNVWYDRYAYPLVRIVRTLMGRGNDYPRNPRAFLVPANVHVHVNEQLWLSTPPQHRREGLLLALARKLLFGAPPFRWFFEREVFAVGEK